MKKQTYDLIIVGAGPAGSILAKKMAEHQYSVLLLEKRPVIGSPVRCGEATSTREKLSRYAPIKEESIETDLNGVVLHANGGVSIKADMPSVGVMLDRSIFDPWLAECAAEAGAEVITEARVCDIKPPQNGKRKVLVDYNGDVVELEATMVAGCDGVEALTGRWTGLKTRQLPPKTCSAIELKIDVLDPNPDCLTFWHGHDFINDGYIWSFPKMKSGTTNFGAGFLTPKLKAPNIKEVADMWLEKIFPEANVLSVMGGSVPVSGNLEEYVADHFILVGDSAHHTNPLTGGGIMASIVAAGIACDHLHLAFQKGDFSKTFLEDYQDKVMLEFGNTHAREGRYRDHVLKMDSDEQTRFYKLLQNAMNKGKFKAVVKDPLFAMKTAWDFHKLK